MHFGTRKAGGYVIASGGPGPDEEHDTIACHHCQRHIVIPPGPPKADEGDLYGVCWTCDKFICPACAQLGRCQPWERQIEAMEARDRMLRSILG